MSTQSLCELHVNFPYAPIQGISILFSIILCEIIHRSVATQVTNKYIFSSNHHAQEKKMSGKVQCKKIHIKSRNNIGMILDGEGCRYVCD